MSGTRIDPVASVVDDAGRLRRRATLLVVLLGLAICMPAGGSAAALALAGAIGVVVGRVVASRSPERPGGPPMLWRVLNTCVFVTCLLAAFANVPLVAIGTGMIAWLQVHRSFTGVGARDDRVALLLGMLMALLGCDLSNSPLLAPLLLVLFLVAPVALTTCHLGMVGEDARMARLRPGASGGLSLRNLVGLGPVTLALTVVFFIVLPRLDAGRGLSGDEAERVTGFGEDVDLGDLGDILESDERVMRVRATDADGRPWGGQLYLRGNALDRFDGRSWASTTGGGGRLRKPPPTPGSQVVLQEIQLEPLADRNLFGLHEVVAFDGLDAERSRDANGTLRYAGEPRSLRYTAISRLPTEDLDLRLAGEPDVARTARSREEREAARSRAWTQLPDGLDPRIPALARQILDEAGRPASTWARALAISSYLQTHYEYTLLAPEYADGGPPADPLAWFLFDGRQGHCEYFATALVILLRTHNIPARLVNGFLGGEYNELGDWTTVRQRDAHSWVEVNLGPEVGWVTLEATPAGASPTVTRASLANQALDWLDRAWQDAVVDYAFDDQLAGLGALGALLSGTDADDPRFGLGGTEQLGGLLLVVTCGLLLALLVRAWLRFLSREAGRRPRRRAGAVEAAWRGARKELARRGWSPPDALPPVALAGWLREQAGDAAAPVEALAWMVYAVRYGGEDDGIVGPRAKEALYRLRKGDLPRAPAPTEV
ncbi:MAG: DUF3488 domain-containing protein [Alphaproteobacteria bacterium]|nr:DUF3488 domain-containing protein [Alphaproteobacteria bacterium]